MDIQCIVRSWLGQQTETQRSMLTELLENYFDKCKSRILTVRESVSSRGSDLLYFHV